MNARGLNTPESIANLRQHHSNRRDVRRYRRGMEDWRAFEELYLQSRTVYSEQPLFLPETLPPVIQAFYARYGLCSFGNFLWTLDPLAWQEAYLPWFEAIAAGERDLDPATTYPFMRTAFGDVFYCCGKQLGFVSVSTGTNNHLNMNFYLNVSLTEDDGLRDLYFRGIFEEVNGQEKLSPRTCLGFLPPLALGGEIGAEHAHVVDLQTHLAFLAEFIEEVRSPVDTHLEIFGL